MDPQEFIYSDAWALFLALEAVRLARWYPSSLLQLTRSIILVYSNLHSDVVVLSFLSLIILGWVCYDFGLRGAFIWHFSLFGS